jgi:IS5 family transposase
VRFRHLLEQHNSTEQIFNAINQTLVKRGLFLKAGTFVDANVIAKP